MSDEIRVTRPAQPSQQPAARPEYQPQSEPMMQQKNSRAPWIILGVVVVVLVILGILFRNNLFNRQSSAMTATGDQPSGYQAVFLTNGQVYFGKMSDANGNYADLKDIFYLQVVQPPLQGSGQAAAAASQAQPQISLVKLGNELHGPVDEMRISRAQILFYEDLKADGQVVKAIEAYKANPSNQATSTPAQ